MKKYPTYVFSNKRLVRILEVTGYDKVKVKFMVTGYIRECRYSHLSHGLVKDHLAITVSGVGFLGNDYMNIRNIDRALCKKIRAIWEYMLARCYNVNDTSYMYYGGNNVSVDSNWFDFCNFYRDFIKLPGYDYKKFMNGILTLDKDGLQLNSVNKIYSKSTCQLITMSEQHAFIKRDKSNFTAISPDGVKYENCKNIAEFARNHNLIPSNISFCISGRYSHHKNWKFYNNL